MVIFRGCMNENIIWRAYDELLCLLAGCTVLGKTKHWRWASPQKKQSEILLPHSYINEDFGELLGQQTQNRPRLGEDVLCILLGWAYRSYNEIYLLANPIFRWIGYKLIFIPDDEWIFRWFHAASRANKSIRQQTGIFPPGKEFPIFPFYFLIQAERVCFRTKINGRVAFITTKKQLPRRRRKKLSKEEDCYRSIETYTARE